MTESVGIVDICDQILRNRFDQNRSEFKIRKILTVKLPMVGGSSVRKDTKDSPIKPEDVLATIRAAYSVFGAKPVQLGY